MLGFIFLGILWTSSSGQQFRDPSFDNKPLIRRLRPDDLDEPAYMPPLTTEEPPEPDWVSLLRNNIKTAIKYRGYDNAKDSIKQMIDNADQEINGNRNSRPKESVGALRSFTDGFYGYSNNEVNRPSPRSKWEPRWEKDLKNYIKGLIGQYGKSHLDDYVRPVVGAIETSKNVLIRDIDGEVSVNWKPAKESPGRL